MLNIKIKKMKKILYLIIILFFSIELKAQKTINKTNKKIVEHLNTPTKIWMAGDWKTQLNGSKVWQKGHWRFEEKCFQQKSEIFRKKMKKRQQV